MIGRIVSHYEILEELGRGGMGVVFKARDTSLDRFVALKFLPSDLTRDEEARERFVREARAAAAADHPNVCTIHEIAETDDGQTYIVMAYYGSRTLKEVVADGPMPVERLATVASQLVRGLLTAHAAGIVHRDIKPGNIVLSDDDTLKILDFGLAKLAGATDLTRTSSTLGTVFYMAPEQVRAEEVTSAADVWAVGATLFHLVTGSPPFMGDYDQAIQYGILNERLDSVSVSRPDLPPDLVTFIDRCLEKDPVDRPILTSELADRLLDASSAPAPDTRDDTPGAEARKWYHEPVRLAAAYAAAAVVTLALVYLLMIGAGLPDWILVLAGILLALGFPALLTASRFDSHRSATSPATGFRTFWTLGRAIRAGALAFGGLVVLTTLFVVTRMAGIGPAATLYSSGVLGEQDRILLAEFENRTSDSTLALSVTELMRIDLNQSRVIRIVQPPEIRETLERMALSLETPLNADVAEEMARREGIKAVITGSVAHVAGSFVLSAEVIATADGQTRIAVREVAKAAHEIVDAADRLSASLRDRIGESLRDIRSSPPLSRVTTGSMDALVIYSEAMAAFNELDYERAVPLFQEATRADSTFAMAYRALAVTYSRLSSDLQAFHSANRTAFRLRDRLPDVERLQVAGLHYWGTEYDPARAVNAYRSLLKIDSTDKAALVNIAGVLNQSRRFAEAVPYGERAVRLYPEQMAAIDNLLDAYVGSLDTLAAETLTREAHKFHGDSWVMSRWRTSIAGARRDYATVMEELDTWRSAPDHDLLSQWHESWNRYAVHGVQGRIEEARRALDRFADISLERGLPYGYVAAVVERGLLDVWYVDDTAGAVRRVEEALRRHPLEAMAAENRPYDWLALFFANVGQLDRAEQMLDEYDSLLPNDDRTNRPSIHAARGAVALVGRRFDEALQHFTRCDEMTSGWPNALCGPYEIGLALEGAGHTAEAIRELLKLETAVRATRLTDERRVRGPAYLKLGELYEREGDLEQAVVFYGKLLDLWKDADAELEPVLADVRQRIDRLAARQAEEPAG